MMTAIRWIGGQSNRLASAIRAFMYMTVALSWTQLTEAQIGTILLFTEALLNLFVETNTVSKVRMGERMDEVEAKVEIKAEQKADAKVAALVATPGSGVFNLPPVA